MITNEDLDAMGYSYYSEGPNQMTPSQMVADYYKTAGITPDHMTCSKLVVEEFDEWVTEYKRMMYYDNTWYKKENELKELADLLFVAYGYALSRGWDIQEAFKRVYENNLQRMFWDDGEIHRDSNGKILKSPTAPTCNLEDLV